MTDKELLTLAAKAAGLGIEGLADKLVVFPGHYAGGFSVYNNKGGSQLWNPLTDDGDALRLAVKLSLLCDRDVSYAPVEVWEDEDPYAATRRAIVRAAAQIGKEIEVGE